MFTGGKMKLHKGLDIRTVRINNNWSREDLSQKLNIPETTLISWESGKYTPPNKVINRLNIIAGIL